MTRINLVPVDELFDQHLLAEHREIKRIPNTIKSWRYQLDGIPHDYVLWTWHVKFFYNKLLFLHKRYQLLYKECIKRWFSVQNYNESFMSLPKALYNDYSPTEKSLKLNRKRLEEKYKKNFYRYYGEIQ